MGSTEPAARPGARGSHQLFSRAAHWTADWCGRATTFAFACLLVILWAASGPYFHFSDTWQLIINTSTTIVTFLMIFLLQHAHNRDSATAARKLDTLLALNQDLRDAIARLGADEGAPSATGASRRDTVAEDHSEPAPVRHAVAT